jgi:hypothetical protein
LRYCGADHRTKFEYCVEKPGNDPRDTGAESHTAYFNSDSDQEPAFPVHEACYKILTKCLATRERRRIDKDILHAVMLQHTTDFGTTLTIDYGTLDSAEQFWSCQAGEEWFVADPCPKNLGADGVVKSTLPARLFDKAPPTPLFLAHKVRHDLFHKLPYDVVHGIFLQLAPKDMHSLMTASYCVQEASREPSFARLMIRVHLIPFFWELDGLLRSTELPKSFDWRGAYHWLNDVTKPSFGLSGPLMGIANRRRIWNSGLQLAPMYHEMLDPEAYIDPPDTEAASIMATATALHTPVTRFP